MRILRNNSARFEKKLILETLKMNFLVLNAGVSQISKDGLVQSRFLSFGKKVRTIVYIWVCIFGSNHCQAAISLDFAFGELMLGLKFSDDSNEERWAGQQVKVGAYYKPWKNRFVELGLSYNVPDAKKDNTLFEGDN